MTFYLDKTSGNYVLFLMESLKTIMMPLLIKLVRFLTQSRFWPSNNNNHSHSCSDIGLRNHSPRCEILIFSSLGVPRIYYYSKFKFPFISISCLNAQDIY